MGKKSKKKKMQKLQVYIHIGGGGGEVNRGVYHIWRKIYESKI